MENSRGIRTLIIGVCGFIGSGKNTVAEFLVEKHNFVPVSFAHVLKDACASLFGWDREMLEGKTEEARVQREQVDKFWAERLQIPCFTPRYALQYIGTDILREHFHKDVWVIAAEKRIQKYKDVVISDVRFPNEVKMIYRNAGELWMVRRGLPEWYDMAYYEPKRMAEAYPEIHSSEYAWVRNEFDVYMDNDGTLEELYEKVEREHERLCA